jgi:hypothetical protein
LSGQGWDRADHSCGRCGHRFTATTEDEFTYLYSLHAAAHDIAAGLIALPALRHEVFRVLGLLAD